MVQIHFILIHKALMEKGVPVSDIQEVCKDAGQVGMCASWSRWASKSTGECANVLHRQKKPWQIAVLFICFFLNWITWCQSSLQQDPQFAAGSPSHWDDATYRPSNVASLKLVRYLQERVKKLRLENGTCSLSPSRPAVSSDLPGFNPTTVCSLLWILYLVFILSTSTSVKNTPCLTWLCQWLHPLPSVWMCA